MWTIHSLFQKIAYCFEQNLEFNESKAVFQYMLFYFLEPVQKIEIQSLLKQIENRIKYVSHETQ